VSAQQQVRSSRLKQAAVYWALSGAAPATTRNININGNTTNKHYDLGTKSKFF